MYVRTDTPTNRDASHLKIFTKNISAASPGVLFVDSNYEEDLADAEPLRHSDLGSGSDTLSKAVSIPDMTMLRC